MFKSRLQMILILLTLLIIYIFSDMYFAYFVLLIMVITVIVATLIPLISKNKLRLHIRSLWSTYKSQEGKVFLRICHSGIFPITKLQCTLLFTNTLTNDTTKEEIVVAVNGKDTVELPIHFMSNQVGRIVVEIKDVRLYDYFQLFSVPVSAHSTTSIFVLPTSLTTRFVEQPVNRELGEHFAHHHHHDLKGIDGIEVIGLKEYAAGENVKKIHWKLTSKVDRPIIKELSDSQENKPSIFIFYENVSGKHAQEISARIEAFLSLSKSFIENHYPHTIGWFDEKNEQMILKEIHSNEQLTSLQRVILSMTHCQSVPKLLKERLVFQMNRYSRIFYIASADGNVVQTKLNENHLTVLTCVTKKQKSRSNNQRIYFTPETLEKDLSQLVI